MIAENSRAYVLFLLFHLISTAIVQASERTKKKEKKISNVVLYVCATFIFFSVQWYDQTNKKISLVSNKIFFYREKNKRTHFVLWTIWIEHTLLILFKAIFYRFLYVFFFVFGIYIISYNFFFCCLNN